ncbi:MAG: hypothetical protein PW791_09430 [Neorhizobium sp.]|nr:hypothetical protein [Neorhizobium sp.]
MFRVCIRLALVAAATLPLMSFRMPAADKGIPKLLYDVRGAVVMGDDDSIPKALVSSADRQIDQAIRQTMRSLILPRTIISVRIGKIAQEPLLIGRRYVTTVNVQAISVDSGEPVAEGSFKASAFLFSSEAAEAALAGKISERIASEFRLGQRQDVLATAFAN